MKILRLFLLFPLFFASLSIHAQTGIYATFTGANLDADNTTWIYGPTVGVYFDRWHFGLVSAGIDLRGQFLGDGGNTQLNSGLGGPRVAITPHILPIKPYAEAVFGVGYTKINQSSFYSSSTDFEYNFLGGVDFTFFPHVDWRIAEFSYGGLSPFEGTLHPKTLSTGIVLRLP
jgi:hypothetical protein